MSVAIDVTYDGQLRCTATHRPSGQKLTTDAPLDNGGKGELFSPTDLMAAALGTCILTVMGLVAERNKLDIRGTRVEVLKEMASAPLRRIGEMRVRVTFPAGRALSPADRAKLEHTAHTCPVHQSLHPETRAPIEFVYP